MVTRLPIIIEPEVRHASTTPLLIRLRHALLNHKYNNRSFTLKSGRSEWVPIYHVSDCTNLVLMVNTIYGVFYLVDLDTVPKAKQGPKTLAALLENYYKIHETMRPYGGFTNGIFLE